MSRVVGAAGKINTRFCWSIAALALAFLSGIGSPGGGVSPHRHQEVAHPSRPGRNEARPVQWIVWGPIGENGFRIGNHLPWCPNAHGTNGPRIVGVHQIDRPKRVTLIAYLVSGKTEGCLGVEAQVEHVVHIRGGLRGRPLFDGSQSPPVRRWPRPSAG